MKSVSETNGSQATFRKIKIRRDPKPTWADALKAGFVVVPNAVIRGRKPLGLTLGEHTALLLLLDSVYWSKEEKPTVETRELETTDLSEWMGIDRKTAWSHLKKLADLRYIERLSPPARRRSRYVIDLDRIAGRCAKAPVEGLRSKTVGLSSKTDDSEGLSSKTAEAEGLSSKTRTKNQSRRESTQNLVPTDQRGRSVKAWEDWEKISKRTYPVQPLNLSPAVEAKYGHLDNFVDCGGSKYFLQTTFAELPGRLVGDEVWRVNLYMDKHCSSCGRKVDAGAGVLDIDGRAQHEYCAGADIFVVGYGRWPEPDGTRLFIEVDDEPTHVMFEGEDGPDSESSVA